MKPVEFPLLCIAFVYADINDQTFIAVLIAIAISGHILGAFKEALKE